MDLKLFRRNIIISGVHLNSLIGKRFSIGDVEFEGLKHCSPCTWMNAVFAKGMFAQMAGRGGLRVRVINGGKLSLGTAKLLTDAIIDYDPLKALEKPNIPS